MDREPIDSSVMTAVGRELECVLQPLRERLDAQEARLAQLAASAWALEVAGGLLRELLPAERAGDAARAVQAALEAAPPEFRASAAGRALQDWQAALTKTHLYVAATWGGQPGGG